MGYRRLFIMRKDLHMSPGKLAAQVAHCAEAYWTNDIRNSSWPPDESVDDYTYRASFEKRHVRAVYQRIVCEDNL